MEYSLRRITDASSEPVTEADAKAHLRLADDLNEAEQKDLELKITAARRAVELYLGRPIGTQTWELGLRNWPAKVCFPRPPLISIVSIKYRIYNESGWTTLHDLEASPPVASNIFLTDVSSDPGELWLKGVNLWPLDLLERGFPVRIRFTCGLDPAPQNVKQAVLLMLGHLYENREASVEPMRHPMEEIPMGVQDLCAIDRFVEFG